jgi:hypothetical protein
LLTLRAQIIAYLFPGSLDGGWTCADVERLRPDLYASACAATGTDPFERRYEDTRLIEPALVALMVLTWAARAISLRDHIRRILVR